MSKALLPSGHFNMRVLGGIHALLPLLALWLCLGAVRTLGWRMRTASALIFPLVFSDAEYFQFFSKAYMDAASLVFLMLVFAVAWNVAINPQKDTWRWGFAFSVASALAPVVFLATTIYML